MKTSLALKAMLDRTQQRREKEYALLLRTAKKLGLFDKEIKRLTKRMKDVRKVERDNARRYSPIGDQAAANHHDQRSEPCT